jgi:hypothetical protein
VPLTGTGWDFTLTAPTTTTVKGGSTGSFQVTVTPLGGFNQATALACTGAPMKSTCVVAPTSVTANDGVTAQNATVTISANGMMVPPPTTPIPPVSVRQIVPLLLALTLLFFLFTTRRLRTRLGMATVILVLIALAGCNNYNGPKRGTTNLTITATSGSVIKTKTVALTIN